MVNTYNTTLNPIIWNEDMTLKTGVSNAINNVVQQFVEDLPVPIEIVDVRIVGSNASYNYTEFSDIDVHIVVNNELLPYEPKMLKLLYNSARSNFNKYYSIKIKGLPIEISIEDLNSNLTSNGIYSVTNNSWIKKPQPITVNAIDVTNTESYLKLCNKINQILDNPNSKDIKDMINHLYVIRKNSILIDGEYGIGNLIFKAIRNVGLLQKLKEELYDIISRELTFESMLEDSNTIAALKFIKEDE